MIIHHHLNSQNLRWIVSSIILLTAKSKKEYSTTTLSTPQILKKGNMAYSLIKRRMARFAFM